MTDNTTQGKLARGTIFTFKVGVAVFIILALANWIQQCTERL